MSLSESTFQPARLSVLSGETGIAAPISGSVRIQGTTAEEVPGALKAFNKVPSDLVGRAEAEFPNGCLCLGEQSATPESPPTTLLARVASWKAFVV